MTEIEQLKSEFNQLSDIVTDLEAKVNDMWSRPLMPHTDGASPDDVLKLNSDLRPYWTPV